jgi:hypothetical protein
MTPAATIALVALGGGAGGDEGAAIEAPQVDASSASSASAHGVPSRIELAPIAPRIRPDLVVPALHAVALMSVMRVTETVLWPRPFAESGHFATHYAEAYTTTPKFDPDQPFMQWDGDPLVVNVVGHGLFGSELYLRARQCRLGWAGSGVFAAMASAVWEYGFEANGVRPSALDLVYTPLAGIALGEARFVLYRAARALSSPLARTIVRSAVDPFGEIERAAGTGC